MEAQRQIRSFEDLECWKACRALRLFVLRKVLPRLPKDEQFELRVQLRKAARSTTANIAEGYGRFHFLDNSKFCSNARGSCWEVLDHLITSSDDSYIEEEQLREGRQLVERAVQLLNGYMAYLKKAAKEYSVREESAAYMLTGQATINE